MTEFVRVDVDQIPEWPEPGKLYVSEEYEIAVHLCACGCGRKTVTPLDGNGWVLTDGPTLHPSISQRICRAHYWIRGGRIVWC